MTDFPQDVRRTFMMELIQELYTWQICFQFGFFGRSSGFWVWQANMSVLNLFRSCRSQAFKVHQWIQALFGLKELIFYPHEVFFTSSYPAASHLIKRSALLIPLLSCHSDLLFCNWNGPFFHLLTLLYKHQRLQCGGGGGGGLLPSPICIQ